MYRTEQYDVLLDASLGVRVGTQVSDDLSEPGRNSRSRWEILILAPNQSDQKFLLDRIQRDYSTSIPSRRGRGRGGRFLSQPSKVVGTGNKFYTAMVRCNTIYSFISLFIIALVVDYHGCDPPLSLLDDNGTCTSHRRSPME